MSDFRSTAATVTEVLSEYADFDEISTDTVDDVPVSAVYRDNETEYLFRIRIERVTDEDMCPDCGSPLDERGPFDGSEANTGIIGGHEGFGDTFLCPNGHWYVSIQGALIPPSRVLTVVEGKS